MIESYVPTILAAGVSSLGAHWLVARKQNARIAQLQQRMEDGHARIEGNQAGAARILEVRLSSFTSQLLQQSATLNRVQADIQVAQAASTPNHGQTFLHGPPMTTADFRQILSELPMNAEIENLKKQIVTLNAKITEITAQQDNVVRLEAQLLAKDEEITQLKTIASSTANRKAMSKLRSDNEGLKEEVERLQKNLDRLYVDRDEIDRLKKQLSEAFEARKDVEKELGTAKTENQSLQKAILEAQSNTAKLQEEISRLRSAKASAESEANQAQKLVAQHDQELRKLRNSSTGSDEAITTAEKLLAESKQEHERTLAAKRSAESDLDAATEKISELEGTVKKLTLEKLQLDKEQDNATKQISKLQGSIKKLQIDKRQLDDELNNAKMQNSKSVTFTQELTSAKDQVVEQLHSKTEQILQLENTIQKLTSDKVRLNDQLGSVNRECQETLKSANDEHRAAIKALETARTEDHERLISSENEVNQLKFRVDQLQAFESANKAAEARALDAENRLQNYKAEKNQEFSEYGASIIKYEGELQTKQNLIKELQSEAKGLRESNERYKKTHAKLGNYAESARQQLIGATAVQEELQRKTEECNSLYGTLRNAEATTNNLQAERDSAIEELRALKQKMEDLQHQSSVNGSNGSEDFYSANQDAHRAAGLTKSPFGELLPIDNESHAPNTSDNQSANSQRASATGASSPSQTSGDVVMEDNEADGSDGHQMGNAEADNDDDDSDDDDYGMALKEGIKYEENTEEGWFLGSVKPAGRMTPGAQRTAAIPPREDPVLDSSSVSAPLWRTRRCCFPQCPAPRPFSDQKAFESHCENHLRIARNFERDAPPSGIDDYKLNVCYHCGRVFFISTTAFKRTFGNHRTACKDSAGQAHFDNSSECIYHPPAATTPQIGRRHRIISPGYGPNNGCGTGYFQVTTGNGSTLPPPGYTGPPARSDPPAIAPSTAFNTQPSWEGDRNPFAPSASGQSGSDSQQTQRNPFLAFGLSAVAPPTSNPLFPSQQFSSGSAQAQSQTAASATPQTSSRTSPFAPPSSNRLFNFPGLTPNNAPSTAAPLFPVPQSIPGLTMNQSEPATPATQQTGAAPSGTAPPASSSPSQGSARSSRRPQQPSTWSLLTAAVPGLDVSSPPLPSLQRNTGFDEPAATDEPESTEGPSMKKSRSSAGTRAIRERLARRRQK